MSRITRARDAALHRVCEEPSVNRWLSRHKQPHIARRRRVDLLGERERGNGKPRFNQVRNKARWRLENRARIPKFPNHSQLMTLPLVLVGHLRSRRCGGYTGCTIYIHPSSGYGTGQVSTTRPFPCGHLAPTEAPTVNPPSEYYGRLPGVRPKLSTPCSSWTNSSPNGFE